MGGINFDDIFDSIEAQAVTPPEDDVANEEQALDELVTDMADSEDEPATTPQDNVPLKGKVEAALFMTNKPLSIAEISQLLDAGLDDVEEALMALMNDLAFRADSALEIDDTDGYMLQIRSEYQPVMDKMLPMELSQGALKTLSAIAIKAPILQSELVLMRGVAVYDHIPELLAKKLVVKKREGRSYKLNVTQTFYEYFKLKGNKKELEVMMALMGEEEITLPKRVPRTNANGDDQLDMFVDVARDDVVAANFDAT